MNDERIGKLLQALGSLTQTAGEQETTKIVPNCEVVDSTPAGLTGYIIVKNELGYYIPAVKSPDITYQDGDFVNLLIIKGTEPIAFQHGSGSGTGGYPGALPLTTKGDLLTRDTSDNIRLGVGTNDKVLMARSTETSGLFWEYPYKLGTPDGNPAISWEVNNTGDITNTGNGVLDVNGIADAIVLDADADTSISAPTDDQIDFEAGGVDIARITGEGVIVPSRVVQGNWFDFPLFDSANTSGIADHFRQNASGAPSGWTQVNADSSPNTTEIYSFWKFAGNVTTWKYRRQTNINIESLGASITASFLWGPILFRTNTGFGDMHFRFGIYRNNAGAIDENTYCRIDLFWDNAAALWKARGEEKDGTVSHNGAYFPLSTVVPTVQPLYFRTGTINATPKTVRAQMGVIPFPGAHDLIFLQNPTTDPTWGQVWVQIEMSVSVAVFNTFYIGAVDYPGNFG